MELTAKSGFFGIIIPGSHWIKLFSGSLHKKIARYLGSFSELIAVAEYFKPGRISCKSYRYDFWCKFWFRKSINLHEILNVIYDKNRNRIYSAKRYCFQFSDEKYEYFFFLYIWQFSMISSFKVGKAHSLQGALWLSKKSRPILCSKLL